MRRRILIRTPRVARQRLGTPATLLAYASVFASVAVTHNLATTTTFARDRVVADSVHSLTFDWAAVNLALQPPYDTVQLRAIPRSGTGAMIPEPMVVQYTTPDTSISVSATGLVTAKRPTRLAHVIARVTQGGRTIVDTAAIQVTDQPFPGTLVTLSIQPQGGGLTSARGNLNTSDYNIGLNGKFPFFAAIEKPGVKAYWICSRRQEGCPQYPMLVHFATSDSTIASIDNGGAWFRPRRPGRVTFTISTIAYGVRKVDSLPFSVGYQQRAAFGVYADTTHGTPGFALKVDKQFAMTPPYSVGVHVFVNNYTSEPIEVHLPQPTQGVYFIDPIDKVIVPLSESVDTLTAKGGAVLVLDSAGTYVLRCRSLKTGTVFSDTITTLPYP